MTTRQWAMATLVAVGLTSSCGDASSGVDARRSESLNSETAPDTSLDDKDVDDTGPTTAPDTTVGAPDPTRTTLPPLSEGETILNDYVEEFSAAIAIQSDFPEREPELDAYATEFAEAYSIEGSFGTATDAVWERRPRDQYTSLDLIVGNAVGGFSGQDAEDEESLTAALPDVLTLWGESPRVVGWGAAHDGESAAIVVRFRSFETGEEPAAVAYFNYYIEGMVRAGALPAITHDPNLDAVAARLWDVGVDENDVRTYGALSTSSAFIAAPPDAAAPPPESSYASPAGIESFNALRTPTATRYGVSFRPEPDGSYAVRIVTTYGALSPDQFAAEQVRVRDSSEVLINRVRAESGLAPVVLDDAANIEAQRIADILAANQSIDEFVDSDWSAWLFSDVLLPGGLGLSRADIIEDLGLDGATPTVGIGVALGADGLAYYAAVGR
jgi:hypothetical protein